MSKFYETESETRWWLGLAGRTWLFIAFVMLTGAVVTLVSVVAAPWSGRGDAYRKQQSGDNRIGQNSQFFNLKAQYDADVSKIPLYKQQAASGSTLATINLQGLQSHCLDMVQQYAAASGAYISKDFKDANLPDVLDPSACK